MITQARKNKLRDYNIFLNTNQQNAPSLE